MIDYGFADTDCACPHLVLERRKRYKNPMQEATPPAAIVLKDLQKFYAPSRSGMRAFLQPFERATRPALKGVTFQVNQGEAVALLGANGAGKSTILRSLWPLFCNSLICCRPFSFTSGFRTSFSW
jgi:ABC-type glutathione transport system ATPase component